MTLFLDHPIGNAKWRELFRTRPAARSGGSLSFCSNDRLALANRLAEAEARAAGASRLLSGDRAIHSQLETQAAGLVAQPNALLCTVGMRRTSGFSPPLQVRKVSS
ncbi:MAG: hypothetical protein M3O46_11085 [Myxococcota bacterium]|nr:hypothetical protein [Myxococcota bacterium]